MRQDALFKLELRMYVVLSRVNVLSKQKADGELYSNWLNP
jgi:hypothetical protein